MTDTAKLTVGDQTIELPIIVGSENEHAIDISKLRAQTGYITLDEGYGNTGACQSAITYIDGDKGILRYRGIPIEDLAENSSFIEVAYLLIWGHLPSAAQLEEFSQLMTKHSFLREQLHHHFEAFPPGAPPMAVLSAALNSMACYYPELLEAEDIDIFQEGAARIVSKMRSIAAYSFKHDMGHALVYPHPDKNFSANFLHMMFSEPHKEYEPDPALVRALDVLLLLHADHEQNCSTSTVRMVGSSGANLFASVAAGVSALWGPLHGGANVAVVEMLETIEREGLSVKDYVQQVKDKKAGIRLMGFGHRVYKNFDPRAKIIKQQAEAVLKKINRDDPLLAIAEELEGAALEEDYFKERRLYPNVDFYSGVILRALGIPTAMYTVMFAIGRMPGWIAQWFEGRFLTKGRIQRPRQIYTGPTEVCYVPLDKRV
ncbi:MAG TPA: citrate (Si)-synthase [Candidatus Latescibacteria bacterium]|nr:citrate (Si)-synthase [Candidatus Latescibacterota bacterium]